MRFAALAVTLLACVEAARSRRVFKRADAELEADVASTTLEVTEGELYNSTVAVDTKPSGTESLDDIVQSVWNAAAGTVRTALSPDGAIRYTFKRHERSISSKREYLHQLSKMSNGERLKRGMQPRKPGRLYVGPDGRLNRKRNPPTTTGMTCSGSFTLGIEFQYQTCDPSTSGVSSCLELAINAVDCKAGIEASACLVGLFGWGAATVWSSDQGGKCVLMSSCCPTLPAIPVILEQQEPVTVT